MLKLRNEFRERAREALIEAAKNVRRLTADESEAVLENVRTADRLDAIRERLTDAVLVLAERFGEQVVAEALLKLVPREMRAKFPEALQPESLDGLLNHKVVAPMRKIIDGEWEV